MKKKLFLALFFLFHLLSWANKNNANYYNINKIQEDFPTSSVEQKIQNYDSVTISNPVQGYVILLTHYPDKFSATRTYYDMLQEAASQNFLGFFSDTGYTTFIDADQGIVYGFLVEDSDYIVVRFHNLDIISSTLQILDQKMESWKKI